MAYSFEQPLGTGSLTNFSFTFPYISRAHITVAVAGVNTAFTWVNDSTIQLASAPANGVVVEIRRTTPKVTALVNFVDAAVLTEADLDTNTQQLLYIAQEAFDASDSALTLASDGTYDAEGVRIKNVATPTVGTDAVNRDYVVGIAMGSVVLPVDAVNITNIPAGGLAATTVQAAINELDTEKFDKAGGLLTGPIIFEGTTADAFEITLSPGDPTADHTQTMQNKSGTIALTSDEGPVNDFRLTLTSGSPVTVANVTGATTLYCSPYKGRRIGLYDGTNWVLRSSAEFSLALGTLTASLPYDVFCYDNAGTPTLEFTAWTNATTRATALAYQDGVLVKSGAVTRRYLGTFYTANTTTTEDSLSKRYLYNYYNRVIRNTMTQFTADRTSAGATYVEANSEIRAQLVVGVAEDPSFASLSGSADFVPDTTPVGQVGIAFDSTSAVEAGLEATASAQGFDLIAISGYKSAPLAVGFHYITVLGRSTGTSVIFCGTGSTTASKVGLHHALPM